ncbi:Presenilins-associated rhomboid-like protein, mitochondrial [Lonchura striata]|uniref:rhomboid protease n=1 Tax=Lonchura striata TaxID=40157 RepID=A0A218UUX5_9PASE|nr:Presenilins-associated rhomboid-like protein, mitochondrial [Lonchura striata domestica]
MEKSLEKPDEKRLITLGLSSLEETEGRPHCNFLTRGWGGTAQHGAVVASDRTGGNGLELCRSRSRLDIRRRFFTQRTAGHWNRLPKDVAAEPRLAEFKEHLDNTQGYTFTGSAFGSAAIWQYESLKSRVQTYFEEARADWMDKMRPQKRGDFRKQVNSWWNNLTEGQRTVTGALCSPMLLSTFSHFSLFHMAANISNFSFSGVISTFVSYVAKMATGRFEPSLGASGAIMTVLAAVCTKMPEAKLAIILLPMFTFTAGSALKAIIAFDTAGLALGWRLFDHAAHLGGALFGMWYVTYGHELIWKNREPLVKAWHEMRTKNTGKGGGGRSN